MHSILKNTSVLWRICKGKAGSTWSSVRLKEGCAPPADQRRVSRKHPTGWKIFQWICKSQPMAVPACVDSSRRCRTPNSAVLQVTTTGEYLPVHLLFVGPAKWKSIGHFYFIRRSTPCSTTQRRTWGTPNTIVLVWSVQSQKAVYKT